MYDFHYNYILKKYGVDKTKLLFTDTDSLCYNIKTHDVYENLFEDKELLVIMIKILNCSLERMERLLVR